MTDRDGARGHRTTTRIHRRASGQVSHRSVRLWLAPTKPRWSARQDGTRCGGRRRCAGAARRLREPDKPAAGAGVARTAKWPYASRLAHDPETSPAAGGRGLVLARRRRVDGCWRNGESPRSWRSRRSRAAARAIAMVGAVAAFATALAFVCAVGVSLVPAWPAARSAVSPRLAGSGPGRPDAGMLGRAARAFRCSAGWRGTDGARVREPANG